MVPVLGQKIVSAATMESSWTELLEQLAAVRETLDDPRQLSAYADTLSGHLGNIVFYDDQLPQGQNLVHYTSWERALAILRDPDGPTLHMFNYERANDPQEGKLWRNAWGGLREDADWLGDYLPEHEKTLLESGRSAGSTYGCSFSSDVGGVEDNLTFWRLYGNDGEGCSFKVTGQLGKIYRVRYLNEDGSNAKPGDEDEDRKIASLLEQLIAGSHDVVVQAVSARRRDVAMRIATGIGKILGGYQHLAKSRYFEDEREWRMIEVAPELDSVEYDVSGNVVKRYVRGLSLRDVLVTASSITVGPRVPNGGAARAYVEHLIRERNMRIPEVKLSRQVYRPDV